MAASDYHPGLWGRLKSRCAGLFGIGRVGQADESHRQSRFQVEPLEPRILLSGDPVAGAFAHLVDDAAHAMFVNDQAAIVEQVDADLIVDAGHADHDPHAVVVSAAGDERGVEWPSEWTPAATDALAGKPDLRMTIANLVAAFAATAAVEGDGNGHVVAKLATSGSSDETAPPTVTIESESDGLAPATSDTGVPGSGNAHESEQVQTLLKVIFDQVLDAFATRSHDAAGQAAVGGLEIREAKLGAGEVARIDGHVILIDDDGGGVGWSLDGVAAADLGSLALLAEAASQAGDRGPQPDPAVTGIAPNIGPPASGDGPVVSDGVVNAAPAPAAAADPAPIVASFSRTDADPAPEHATTAPVVAMTAPAVMEAVIVAPTSPPAESAPTAGDAHGAAAIGAPTDYGIVESTLADAILGLLALAAAVPAPAVDSRAGEQRRTARTSTSGGDPSRTTAATAATVTSGVASLDDVLVTGPPQAGIADAGAASFTLAVDIMSAAAAEVLSPPLAGDQVADASVTEVDMARGPPVAAQAARGPPSVDYLLADSSSPLASAPATLSTADLQSLVDLALAIWSDALAAKGLSLPAGTPTFLISDLADGILGSTDGSVIRLDVDAAGHGWFVDATPRDASEFPLEAFDPFLDARVEVLEAQLRGLRRQYTAVRLTDQAEAAVLQEEIKGVMSDLARAQERQRELVITSPGAGMFVAPVEQDMPGRFVKKGALVGFVIDASDRLTARTMVGQNNVALVRERTRGVDVIPVHWEGRSARTSIMREVPGGLKVLPTPALGTAGGGSIPIDPRDSKGVTALDRYFEYEIALPADDDRAFLGQRVMVRFDHGTEPIGFQLYRSFRQVFLRLFDV